MAAKGIILLVEDEVDQAQVFSLLFEGAGYEVMHAQTGGEALDILNKQEVDLLICDVVMPGMRGDEFVSKLRSDDRFSSLKVLALTAVEDEDSAKRLRQAGVADICLKSLRNEVLLSRVSEIIASS